MIPKPFLDATTRNYVIEHGLVAHSSGRAANANERQLGSFRLPPFQRPSVWTMEQKVRFIESIWLHLPIASYVVNRDEQDRLGYPCEDWLLDGQQRWTAIIEYTEDMFRVFDLLFSELTNIHRRKFKSYPFPCIETRNLKPKQCKDVYDRLAYGGTNH
jgi:uncharacterized protein with ParB-like and HNH nuclease domain